MATVNEHLSGRYYHKKTIFGLVLMVEVIAEIILECDIDAPSNIERLDAYWRKATQADLLDLNFQPKRNTLKKWDNFYKTFFQNETQIKS